MVGIQNKQGYGIMLATTTSLGIGIAIALDGAISHDPPKVMAGYEIIIPSIIAIGGNALLQIYRAEGNLNPVWSELNAFIRNVKSAVRS